MKLFIAGVLILLSINSYAQQSQAADNINQWKKAVVKIESIQQRYNFAQVDAMLHKQTDSVKGLSQHEKYNTQGELLTISDTIRGTGFLVSDGNKVYLVTAKHLIKATENAANNTEIINDLITIKTNTGNKVSNDISLMNLSENKVSLQPFVFSSNKEDIGIISFQKASHRTILTYMKQEGCVPIPIQSINTADEDNTGDKVSTMGFPALPGPGQDDPVVSNGTITSYVKTSASFNVDLNVYPGNTGGPVIENNKLIGILSFQSGISTNIDAAMHPYQKAASATAIKISSILPLLKELQEHERTAGYK